MREDRVLRKRATHKANGAIMTVPLKKVRKRGKHSSMSTNTSNVDGGNEGAVNGKSAFHIVRIGKEKEILEVINAH